MEQSAPYQLEAVLALGKKLVDELGLSDSVDTLGRWMAHYIAELMEQAERAPTEEQRRAAQQACFETILKLWDHRATALNDARPLASLKSAIAVLKAINGQDEENYYWRHNTRNVTYPWAGFMQSLRRTMDDIVLYSLAGSVNADILSKEKKWIEQHGEFLSDDEGLALYHIDALLQGGKLYTHVIINLNGETKELSPEERQAMILTKISELINNQLAMFVQLQTALVSGNSPATDDVP